MSNSIDSNYKRAQEISDHNLQSLTAITTQQIAKNPSLNRLGQAKVQKMVMKAAMSVLKNMDPYVTGQKTISDKQFKKIEKEFKKIEASVKDKENFFSVTAHQLMGMISRLRNRTIDLRMSAERQTLVEDYYQLMGCVAAYGKWKEGDKIPGAHKDLADYEVHKVIKNKKGLQIVVLTPTRKDGISAPLICCRGTTPFKLHNFIDDLNDHIGQESFEESKEEISDILNEVVKKHGKVVVTGHSLGGAIAQNITAEFWDRIKSIYHFNSPGVGENVNNKYQEEVQNLEEDQRPQVISYHDAHDVVALAGGDHLKADEVRVVGQFSAINLLSPLKMAIKAHSWTHFISESKDKVISVTHFSRPRNVMRSMLEGIRRTASPLFKKIIMNKIVAKQELKDKAKNIVDYLKLPSEERKANIRNSVEKIENELRKIRKSQDRDLPHSIHPLFHTRLSF